MSDKANESIKIDPNYIRKYIQDFANLIQSSKLEDQKELLNSFIDKVYVNQKQATIHYKVPIRTEPNNLKLSKVLYTEIIGSA